MNAVVIEPSPAVTEEFFPPPDKPAYGRSCPFFLVSYGIGFMEVCDADRGRGHLRLMIIREKAKGNERLGSAGVNIGPSCDKYHS